MKSKKRIDWFGLIEYDEEKYSKFKRKSRAELYMRVVAKLPQRDHRKAGSLDAYDLAALLASLD